MKTSIMTCCLLLIIGSLAGKSNAAITITFADGAGGLDVNISGSINTAGADLWNVYTEALDPAIGSANFSSSRPHRGWFSGPDRGNYQWAAHNGTTVNWFSVSADGGYSIVDHTGDDFGFHGDSYMVPIGYVSGSPITSSFTIVGLDLATLAPVDGVALTVSSGDTVGIAAVPEPATAGMLAMSGLLIAAYRRIRKSYGV